MENKEKRELKAIKEEMRKEFQVERMILFSDAVFAIVITLMAIEIKLPHSESKISHEVLVHQLIHLLPTVLAYAVSFFFIGLIWYRHLKIFSIVKSFDTGLVVHNLILLFFVGLFPFGAAIVASVQEAHFIRIMIYLTIIICCIYAQFFLQHYLLIKKPHLCESDADVTHLLKTYKQTIPSIIVLPVVIILIIITDYFVSGDEFKALSSLWIMLVPLTQLVYKKMQKEKSK